MTTEKDVAAAEVVLAQNWQFDPVQTFADAFAHHAQQARLEERERCVAAAMSERVDALATDHPEDHVYNSAIKDVIDAIRKGESDA